MNLNDLARLRAQFFIYRCVGLALIAAAIVFVCGCASLPATVKDARDVQAGVGNVAAKIEKMETRLVLLGKDVQKSVNTRIAGVGNQVSESHGVTGWQLAAGIGLLVVGGTIVLVVLILHAKDFREWRCRYREIVPCVPTPHHPA